MPARQREFVRLLCALVILPALAGCASMGVTADPVYFPPPPGSPRVVHLKSFNRLHDLVPVRGSLLEILRSGSVSPYVQTPAGVAFHSDHLYVCDTGINVVHDWDLATGRARRIGHSGDIVLVKPVAVAVDEAGTVYVADTGRGELVAFDAAGRFIRAFRPPDCDEYRPVSVAVSQLRLYVADIAAHRIDVFSTDDGIHEGSFGGIGGEPGRFYFPMGVALDAAGHIFVSDSMNARVQAFDAGHNPVGSIGRPGNRYGDMGKPRNLALGPDGVVFIADVAFAHIHLFNKQGRLLMLLGGPDDQPGGTPMPVGVTVAPILPDSLALLVPDDFRPDYYLFVTNSVAAKHISLYAVGTAR